MSTSDASLEFQFSNLNDLYLLLLFQATNLAGTQTARSQSAFASCTPRESLTSRRPFTLGLPPGLHPGTSNQAGQSGDLPLPLLRTKVLIARKAARRLWPSAQSVFDRPELLAGSFSATRSRLCSRAAAVGSLPAGARVSGGHSRAAPRPVKPQTWSRLRGSSPATAAARPAPAGRTRATSYRSTDGRAHDRQS